MLEQPGEDALPLSSSSTLSSDNTHISTESTSNDIESQMTSFSVSTAQSVEQEKIFGNDISAIKPLHMGKTLTLLYFKGNPLIVIGPDYPFTLTLLSIECGIFFLLYKFCFDNIAYVVRVMETFVFLIEFGSYSLTALINPGIPSREYHSKNVHKNYQFFKMKSERGESEYQKCSKCNIIVHKQMKVSHCSICNVCVMELDHHCPWTGKCIGKYNLYTFYVFVVGIFVFLVTSFVTFLNFLLNVAETQSNRKVHNPSSP